jgi:predicted Zn-dependent peptidase
MIKINYKLTKLKNGLRVLLVPNKNVDSVQTMVIFRVGSRCEEPQISGVSHFLEHMFFKGTTNRPTAGDISREVDEVGGYMNAFTGYEFTGYYIKVIKQYQEMAVGLLADMIMNSKFEAAELQREKGVIKEEIKMYQDDPWSFVNYTWNETLYGTQGLGREIAGTFETVDGIDRGAMVDYKDRFYSVANGLLVVVGNYVEKDILQMLNQYWGQLPQGEKSVFVPTNVHQKEKKAVVRYRDIQQANFFLGVRAFPNFHPKYFASSILSIILGQGMSSRLFLKVRERSGLAYRIQSIADSYTDAGALVVQTGTAVVNAEKAITMILHELKAMGTKKVGAKELKKAKENWKGKMIISLEDPEMVADIVGTQELLYHQVMLPAEMIKKMEAVTASEVRDLAAELFVPEKLNLAVVGPYKDAKPFEKILKF